MGLAGKWRWDPSRLAGPMDSGGSCNTTFSIDPPRRGNQQSTMKTSSSVAAEGSVVPLYFYAGAFRKAWAAISGSREL